MCDRIWAAAARKGGCSKGGKGLINSAEKSQPLSISQEMGQTSFHSAMQRQSNAIISLLLYRNCVLEGGTGGVCAETSVHFPFPLPPLLLFRRCKNFFPLPRLTLSLSRGATNQPSNQTSHRHRWRRVPKDNGAKGITKNAPKINNHEKIALLNICRAWFLNLFLPPDELHETEAHGKTSAEVGR